MSVDAVDAGGGFGLITRVTVPAQPCFIGLLRRAVRIAVDGCGADDECVTDVGLAVDEVAGILIAQASPLGDVELAVTHDPTDVHIRLVVPTATAGVLRAVDAWSSQLLHEIVDDYDLRHVGPVLVGRLRRGLVRADGGSARPRIPDRASGWDGPPDER